MGSLLDRLARYPIWRGTTGYVPPSAITTGYADLDRLLPGNGWPLGAVIEITSRQHGVGELSLLLPALRQLLAGGQGLIVWVAPRFIPYAPALYVQGLDLNRLLVVQTRNGNESLWAAEQVLRSTSCAALLAWPESLTRKSSRRLQLAAEKQGALVVLFRIETIASQDSLTALKLRLSRASQAHAMARIDLVKCKGAYPQSIDLQLSSGLGMPARAGGGA